MTIWRLIKVFDRGEKGVWAHIWNENPETSDHPNTLADWIPAADLPKYGLPPWDGEKGGNENANVDGTSTPSV